MDQGRDHKRIEDSNKIVAITILTGILVLLFMAMIR
ncbi:hypothetical protein EV200_10434 [Pedobacter psychrotolerans]|uniref:Uncharacterized protein n=1 Tax=Pedobacter psychrotolerans TaxID=1843235 RepID=A0A4R2HBM7_9SPHI|nr:hypothetical protein EV200_10434 [Pedobacter psychrotolerans]